MFGEGFKTSVFGFAMCMAGCECAQAYLVLSYKVLLPCVEKNILLPHGQHQYASYHYRSLLWYISLAVFSSDLLLVSLCAADLI